MPQHIHHHQHSSPHHNKSCKKKKKQCEDVILREKGSLISILKSFGIVIKTKLKYRNELNEGLFERIDNQQKCYRNDGMISDHAVCGGRENISEENSILFFQNDNSKVCVNWLNAKIGIRFKCGFDHLENIYKVAKTVNLHRYENSISPTLFETVLKTDRTNANTMYIDIDLRFKSILQIVDYLKLTEPIVTNLEDEILSRVVEILDIDSKKKQVYFKLKGSIDDIPENPSAYYLMGKIDGSESCFIFDVTETFAIFRNLTSIDKIYKHFTPEHIRNRIYNKGHLNTFHDNREIGIYRVLIGNFFLSTTDPSLSYAKYSCIWANDTITPQFNPQLVAKPDCEWKGSGIVSEKYARGYNVRTPVYGGWIDTGYYKFELRPMSQFFNNPYQKFLKEFYHFVA